MRNQLYFGDNLKILRRNVADESVDLVYLDPPFNSNRDYNILFRDQSGESSPAQIKAFTDTWNWAGAAEAWDSFPDICPVPRVIDLLGGFINTLGKNDVTAYLVMMAPRLYQLHRVLKPTGSLYLHCDPTASHYLKLVLDALFGPVNFRNEIIWQRTAAKSHATRQLPNNHDVLLAYQKSDRAKWSQSEAFSPYDQANLDVKTASKYCHRDETGRLYQLDNLINPNRDRPNLTYEFLGVTRVWRWTKERMQAAFEAGMVVQPSPGAVPRLKRYLDKQRGKPLGDLWADIAPLNSQAHERLGYPTQKPLGLLERIIRLSSNAGDVVLDPFCGCGTAVAAAQALDRRWIGIDITPIATSLIQKRLWDSFGAKDVRPLTPEDPPAMHAKAFDVKGLPVDTPGARALFEADHKNFEMWAVGLVPAIPQEKKGADKGIDGVAYFHDGGKRPSKAVVQVKGGHVGRGQVHELRGVKDREGAALALYICLEEPTRAMREEAISAGFYQPPIGGRNVEAIQIRTVQELLDGKRFELPFTGVDATFARAPAIARTDQLGLDMDRE